MQRSLVSGMRRFAPLRSSNNRSMATIVDGVDFDTVAREWRFKWSGDNNKQSLADAQKVLVQFKQAIHGVEGVKSVQRVVCGGCLDFKVVVALKAENFGAWSEKKFAPEEDFLKQIRAIPGITQVETQTYTLMNV